MEAEQVDIEEKYSSLQEEAKGKTNKLKKVWSMLQNAKSEIEDMKAVKNFILCVYVCLFV